MSDRINITVPDGLGALVDGIVRASGSTGEVPTLSKARVFRLLAYDGARSFAEGDLDIHDVGLGPDLTEDDLIGLIPDHRRAKFLYDEQKNENWLVDMQEGFEKRVRDRLAERFKNGYSPEGAARLADRYVQEAHLFWVEIEDDQERFEQAREYVYDRLDKYRRKYKATSYDPDEEWLEGFSGVEQGEAENEIEQVAGTIRALAEQKIEKGADGDAVVDSIAFVFDVSREQVREIVEDVRREKVIADQQSGGNGSVGLALEDGSTRAHEAHARAPDADREDDGLGSDRVLGDSEAAWLAGGESDD